MPQRKRHSFFQEQNKGFSQDAILIPENPIRLHNDCKAGQWVIGETSYGNRLQFVALRYSRRLALGDDYTPAGKPFGALWFVPIAGGIGTNENGEETKLAQNLVYYTLLKNSSSEKSGSLINFGVKASIVQAQGYMPIGEVVWVPIFKKKSATIEGEAVSYYVLDWNVILPENQDETTYKRIGDIINIFQSEQEMSKLYDPSLETTTRCVDGMRAEEIALLSENLRSGRAALTT